MSACVPVSKLLRLFTYDPETGTIKWKIRYGAQKAGDIAGHQDKKKGRVCGRTIRIDGRLYQAGPIAFALGHGRYPVGMEVDHKDRNGDNNALSNLREGVTRAQQNANQRRRVDNTSGYIGVCRHPRGWQVHVGRHYVGIYADKVEAAKARDRYAISMYGEFASLNFPQEEEDAL